MSAVSRFFDRVLLKCGYVPAAKMRAAIAAMSQVEQALRHKTRNLEHQILLHKRLEKEVAFLRQIELFRAGNYSDTQKAVDKLDAVSVNLDKLITILREVYPEAYKVETVAEDAIEAPSAPVEVHV